MDRLQVSFFLSSKQVGLIEQPQIRGPLSPPTPVLSHLHNINQNIKESQDFSVFISLVFGSVFFFLFCEGPIMCKLSCCIIYFFVLRGTIMLCHFIFVRPQSECRVLKVGEVK